MVYRCEALKLWPASLTAGVELVESPQAIDDVEWVSCEPASANTALRFAVAPSAMAAGTVTEVIVGGLLEIVTLAVVVTAGWNPSVTESVAVTSASSLQVIVGVNVVDPVEVQTVPGLAPHANDHDLVTGSLSGSVALPLSATGEPSLPA